MTNEEIITRQRFELLKQGVLESTGKVDYLTVDENGNEVKKVVDMPEPIHTFAAWKEQGFSVKKGEHAIAKFPIWKYSKKKSEDEEEHGRMFMKMAHFFKFSQVEAIK